MRLLKYSRRRRKCRNWWFSGAYVNRNGAEPARFCSLTLSHTDCCWFKLSTVFTRLFFVLYFKEKKNVVFRFFGKPRARQFTVQALFSSRRAAFMVPPPASSYCSDSSQREITRLHLLHTDTEWTLWFCFCFCFYKDKAAYIQISEGSFVHHLLPYIEARSIMTTAVDI